MNKTQESIKKIETSLEELAKMSAFNDKYKELLISLLKLRKETAILDISVDKISLPQRWYIKYPKLKEDLFELGLSNKLLGFNLNI